MTDSQTLQGQKTGRKCPSCGQDEIRGDKRRELSEDYGMCDYCTHVHRKGDEMDRWDDDMGRIDRIKKNEWPTPETKIIASWLDRHTVPEILRLVPVGYDGKQPEVHTEEVDQLARNIQKEWNRFWDREVAPKLIDACVHPAIIELTGVSENHVDWIYIAMKVLKMRGASQ